MSLTEEQKKAVIRQMITEWEATAFAAEVNIRVADRIGDQAMRAEAIRRLKKAEGAQKALREELDGLGNDGANPKT